MIPDGGLEHSVQYAFSEKLSSRYKIPFLDLASQLKNVSLVYTDGRHLSYDSARLVSEVIGGVIRDNFYPQSASTPAGLMVEGI